MVPVEGAQLIGYAIDLSNQSLARRRRVPAPVPALKNAHTVLLPLQEFTGEMNPQLCVQ